MRGIGLLVIACLTVWRVGEHVNWNVRSFIDNLNNDKQLNYVTTKYGCADGMFYCKFNNWSQKFKIQSSYNIQEVLPSPHSELVMGMVLGENQFNLVPKYNDILKKVGLMHVVVVSGYNISLIFESLMRILGTQYKLKNLIVGLVLTLVYAGISGFGIPSVRAWVMGSMAIVFKYYGRPIEGIKVLIFSGLVIVLISPEQLFSVSFMLSFLATLGVIVIPDFLKELYSFIGINKFPAILEDFNTSLSAQIMVIPVLSYYFGNISLVSLIVNPLVLWVVPVCTVLGGLMVLLALINPILSQPIAFIIFPFLDLFVRFSEFFGGFSSASVSLRFSSYLVFIYYLVLFLGIKFLSLEKLKNNKNI